MQTETKLSGAQDRNGFSRDLNFLVVFGAFCGASHASCNAFVLEPIMQDCHFGVVPFISGVGVCCNLKSVFIATRSVASFVADLFCLIYRAKSL